MININNRPRLGPCQIQWNEMMNSSTSDVIHVIAHLSCFVAPYDQEALPSTKLVLSPALILALSKKPWPPGWLYTLAIVSTIWVMANSDRRSYQFATVKRKCALFSLSATYYSIVRNPHRSRWLYRHCANFGRVTSTSQSEMSTSRLIAALYRQCVSRRLQSATR